MMLMIITEFSFEAKLLRARQHLYALDSEIKGWLATHPYSKIGEFNAQTGEHVVYVEPYEETPPDSISLLIGDCVHNLRVCLDHLAYSLAVRHTGDPLPADMAKTSEFPIFIDDKWYIKSAPSKIRGIAPSAQAVIESLQPYHAGSKASIHALWHLSELCNIDKHRRYNFLLINLINAGAPLIPGVYFQWIDLKTPHRIEGKTKVAHYKVRTLDQSAAVNMDILMSFGIAFKSAPLEDYPIFTTLVQIINFVQHQVVAKLRPFLS
jgi:hypothetical protein